jgi:short subunit dehydrogenase-like uncharacterized protein
VITIYGATGYTGRLVAELLVSRGVELTIAGRNRARLEALKTSLSHISRYGATPQVAPVELEDRRALLRMLERTKVLLTCAGPFGRFGPPLVEACLQAKTHYLDITGEVRFMIDTAARDEEAKKAEVALVNAVGADVVPSDFVAHLATETLGGSVDSVEVAILAERPKVSGGTMRSLVEVLTGSSFALVDGEYVEEPLGQRTRRFEWPGELESKYRDRVAYSAPLGDLATLPRTTGTKNARTYAVMPAMAGAGAKLLSPIARSLLKGKTRELVEGGLPSSGSGPTPRERRKSRFAFIAEAKQSGRVSIAAITGRDMYGLTAHTAAYALVSLCNPAYVRHGALTPMQAIEPGLWRQLLEKIGCQVVHLRRDR